MLKNLPQEKLEAVVWDRFFKDNPQLKRGQTMSHPIGLARDGVLITDNTIEPTPDIVLEARSYKVVLTSNWDLPNMEMGSLRGWVYPYTVTAPEELNHRIGDIAVVMDPITFELKNVAVTQKMLDDYRYIIIRMAVPGQWHPEESLS